MLNNNGCSSDKDALLQFKHDIPENEVLPKGPVISMMLVFSSKIWSTFKYGRDCETPENPRFWIKGKTVISVRKLKYFYISNGETNFSVEIVSQNLATMSNFIGFRGSQDFRFFEVWGVG